MANIHPVEILYSEFLKHLKISTYRLSKELKVPQTRISQIIKGNLRITANTAFQLSKYLGTSAKFWLGLQDDFDIEEEKGAKRVELEMIRKRKTRRGRYLLELGGRGRGKPGMQYRMPYYT